MCWRRGRRHDCCSVPQLTLIIRFFRSSALSRRKHRELSSCQETLLGFFHDIASQAGDEAFVPRRRFR